MKKIISIAFVALIAASTVFAGISGYSNLGFGFNSSNGKFGFNPASALSVDIDIASDSASNVGEGDVYAGISGSVALRLVDAVGVDPSGNDTGAVEYPYNAANDTNVYSVGVFAFINEAYVAGQDWKVAFGTKSSNPVDFAKSAIDTYKTALKDAYETPFWVKDANVSYKAPYASNAGVNATIKGFTVGAGFVGTKGETDTTVGYTAYALTPDFAFGGANAKFGAVVSKANKATANTSIGASAQIAFAQDAFSAKAAADFGFENVDGESAVHFDVAGNVKYDFVSADIYYVDYAKVTTYSLVGWAPVKDSKEYENLLSAKATLDLASFDVPVSLTIKGKDLINSQDLSASAKITVSDAVKVTIGGGYNIKSEKISASAGVEYSAEKFTASADVSFSIKGETKTLVPTVVVSSDALINGATVELSWKPNTDGTNSTTTNLLDKDADYGKFYATVKLGF